MWRYKIIRSHDIFAHLYQIKVVSIVTWSHDEDILYHVCSTSTFDWLKAFRENVVNKYTHVEIQNLFPTSRVQEIWNKYCIWRRRPTVQELFQVFHNSRKISKRSYFAVTKTCKTKEIHRLNYLDLLAVFSTHFRNVKLLREGHRTHRIVSLLNFNSLFEIFSLFYIIFFWSL